ncbi:MAG: hypothetical protein HY897_13955 [Deltaproteobacteria bacterium]|nr:hypothetical protein [Deltaproteobacteria bacterium]
MPAAVLAFMAIAVMDQREVFLPLAGLGPEAAPAPSRPEAAAAAERLVRGYNAAIEAAGPGGGADRLDAVALSGDLRSATRRELAFARTLPGVCPLRSAAFAVRLLDPLPSGGFTVETDETWTPDCPPGVSSPRPSRLRHRYTIIDRNGLRIEQAVPVPPDPVDAKAD